MATNPTVEDSARLSELIDRAADGKERIILSRRGVELAAVVPIEDVRFLRELEDRIDLEDARAALMEEGSISLEQFKAELGL